MNRHRTLFRFDQRFEKLNKGPLAGIDEAGRGPLAGPVVAAAVILRHPISLPGLNDSKKVSEKNREILFRKILSGALVGIGRVSEEIIDKINIYQATRLAMRQAVLALPKTPGTLLIDGKISLDLPLPQEGIVRGDGQSAAIAAASIVAKVHRDYWMRRLDQLYPGSQFSRHKGYPTASHLELLKRRGPSPVHRKSFAPVAALEGLDDFIL